MVHFSSRPSRQATPTESQPNNNPSNNNSPTSVAPTNNRADTSQPSSTSPRMSRDSEGYPSWLPKRPPPPAPASTMHSSVGLPDPDPEPDTDPEHFAHLGGRKPTPRSVRIVSLHGINPPVEKSKPGRRGKLTPGLAPPTRAWSRATAPSMPSDDQAAYTYPYYTSIRIPQPKFNAKNLDLRRIVVPSILARLYFYIFPILAFAHLPLQTYFDFNAVFILIQVSKNPNPAAPGVPGSGKNWALAAAAYVACWLVWIICIFLLYELVYSFIRRWRVKRPLMMPIYLSSPAYTFTSLTSYTNFRFLLHLRIQSFTSDSENGSGSFRDGLAETFYWYSQNLPTVALLLPRAGLSLSLLFAFSSPNPTYLSLASMGINNRDDTYFNKSDGTLTSYAKGVLITNAIWTAWRILVLLVSWIGLWVLSGQGCAGLCGPRYRWEEEEMEKTRSSIYSTANDSNREVDKLAWGWKECTRVRVQESYELCLNTPALRWGGGAGVGGSSSAAASPGLPLPPSATDWKQEKGKEVAEPDPVEVQRVLAAVGIPTVPAPARRPIITGDFFDSPKEEEGKEEEIHHQLRHRESDKGVGSSTSPYYPFNQRGSAQVSSQDRVPFPPSPKKSPTAAAVAGSRSATTTHTSTESTSSSSSGSTETSNGSTEEDDSEEEDEEEDEEQSSEASEEPSTGHASNSMSSLGHPISPSRRYPFGLRLPPRGGGNSTSSRSHQSRPSQSTGISGISQSTGNRPSSTDYSPSDFASISESHDRHRSSRRPRASLSQSSGASGIPMPPRHPNVQSRTRAPSIPLPALPSLPPLSATTAVEFPSVRLRADSGILPGVTVVGDDLMIQDDAESVVSVGSSSNEASGEQQDEVGLLSPGASRTNLSVPGGGNGGASGGSGSARSRAGSSARSRASSNRSAHSNNNNPRSRVSSFGVAVRSRAQSLLHSVSATSLDLVKGATATAAARSRRNSSMARLEEETPSHRLPSELASSPPSRPRDISGSTQESQLSYPYSFSNPQAWEDRSGGGGYVSSSSHSRSGSASGGENWTFGQPMPFMQRPGNSRLRGEVLSEGSDREDNQQQQQSRRLGGGGGRRDSDIEEVTEEFGPGAVRAPRSLVGPGVPGSPLLLPISASVEMPRSSVMEEEAFHSAAEVSTSTATPLSPPTPREGDHHYDHQPTTLATSPAMDIPWGRYRLQEPSMGRGHPDQQQMSSSTTTTSQPDISTAAQSFVTVPATIGGSITTTEASSHGGGGDDDGMMTSRDMRGAGVGGVGLGTGGIGPERRDTMGDWRVR